MEVFITVMNKVNDIIWHPVMCVFLMFAALWFTVRLKGMQVRRLKDMVNCLLEKGDNKEDTGLSSFQAFATTVGGRVEPETSPVRQRLYLWEDRARCSGCGSLRFSEHLPEW